ncbi:LOW QUALITY PROTEIN: interleukin-6 receptor subunit alpha [Struthio camelus]|uniref:LOW QUALITY PROTEIN: interleukin-6 receptor subunit alpha n=1 Tax=Struthio camelus TaxID=8801 RepID=UPI003603CD4E
MARPPPPPPLPLLLPVLPVLLLPVLPLAAAAALPRRPCAPTGLPPDTVLGRPGADVTLSCGAEGLANDTVSWELETGRGRRLALGAVLALRGLRRDDAGRYSCSAGGRPLRTLRLLVQEPPERPRVSCYRRSHDRDVLCEWEQRAKPSPGTRATLWVKRRFTADNATEQPCRYFSKVQKFVCRVRVPPGVDDNKPLVVSTCVRNGAGSAAGEDKIITLSGVLKPDPPLNVTVRALERSPQRLRVTWAYPSSWDPRFYWLRFQVRYRPEPARTFTEVSPRPVPAPRGTAGAPARAVPRHPSPPPPQVDQVTQTSLDIADAWRGTRHVVQVRAQEEFGHGSWSEWSREAVGTPWTEPQDGTPEPFSSQLPAEDGAYGEGATLPPELFGPDAAEEDAAGDGGELREAGSPSAASPYAFPVAGGSLLVAVALFVGLVARYRRRWWGAKPAGAGQHALVPLAPPSPSSPLSDTPLLPPAGPPAPGPFHVTNLDYFFSGK